MTPQNAYEKPLLEQPDIQDRAGVYTKEAKLVGSFEVNSYCIIIILRYFIYIYYFS